MPKYKVVFYPGEKEAVVQEGTDLLAAAILADVHINNSCGGDGVCSECKVRIREGKVGTELSHRLTEVERQAGYCLACRTTVQGDVQVDVPPESRTEQEQILTEGFDHDRLAGLFSRGEEVEKGIESGRQNLFTASPLATKLFIHLPPPSLDDNISDLERLYIEIRRHSDIPIMQMGLANVRRMGRLLRENNWQVTAMLGQRNGTTEVVLLEPGDTSSRNYGIALDIGTTTIVTSLVNLINGEILGTKATHNRQSNYGADVISRIIYAERAEGLEKLHRAVTDAVNEHISALAVEHGISLNDVNAVSCAGNMTMTHLLLRVDPYYIRRAPYVPTANFIPTIRAAEVGIRINPRGLMSCLPGVSSYVGGDITAGVLASGIDEAEEPAMLIDLGTNGEIVLGNREWLVCSSASAGPAFEGSGVRCGVRAVQGAIQGVAIDPQTCEVTYKTIGDAAPIGICGSGYIEVLGELFYAGAVDRQGSIRTGKATSRARQGEDGAEFVLVRAEESGTDHDIVITQADIDNLIRSKGAIYSAAKVLPGKMGMSFEDIDKIYIAGGFGNYLNIEKAIRIGLLPDLPLDRFEFIGNSSLSGSKMTLISYEARKKAEEIAERMTNIELCAEQSYMGEYIGSLFLPHTDIDLFPTVKNRLER